MAGIQAIQAATSFMGAAGTSALGASTQLAQSNSSLAGNAGILSQQVSMFSSSNSAMSQAEMLGALAIALLLGKSDESEKKQDPLLTLAALAAWGAFSSQQSYAFSYQQSTMVSSVSDAYGAGGAGSATGGAVNVEA